MRFRIVIGLTGLLLVAAVVAQAAEPVRPYKVQLRLRLEHDDNIFTTAEDTIESWKVIVDPEAVISYPTELSHLGFRYRFGYVYYDDRPGDDTDYNHDFDFTATHEFSPRFSLSFKDILRYGQEPEAVVGTSVVRRNGDFFYNSANLGGIFSINEAMSLDGGVRYMILDYDEDDVSATLDHDTYVGYVNLNRVIEPATTGVIGYRYESLDYDEFADRDQVRNILMVGVDRIFTPVLLGSARVGWEMTDYDPSDVDDEDSPYADISLTYTYTAGGRLLVGFRYSEDETDLGTFLSQSKVGAYASVSHDITAKVALYLAAGYDVSDYDGDKSVDGTAGDGDEDLLRLSGRVAYDLGVYGTSVEAGYQYTDLSSDFGREYDRNRIHVGLRAVY